MAVPDIGNVLPRFSKHWKLFFQGLENVTRTSRLLLSERVFVFLQNDAHIPIEGNPNRLRDVSG
jgi:hypothetical protein